jgi:hypothetical protein
MKRSAGVAQLVKHFIRNKDQLGATAEFGFPLGVICPGLSRHFRRTLAVLRDD